MPYGHQAVMDFLFIRYATRANIRYEAVYMPSKEQRTQNIRNKMKTQRHAPCLITGFVQRCAMTIMNPEETARSGFILKESCIQVCLVSPQICKYAFYQQFLMPGNVLTSRTTTWVRLAAAVPSVIST